MREIVRRFEYVGGGSAKFWEIGRDGAAVTVRFGRMGTAGQTQVKDLGSDALAQAHVAKLAAEKVGKGYCEVGPTGTAPGPEVVSPVQPDPAEVAQALDVAGPVPVEPEPDEDAWAVPAAWWRQAQPFRGRGPGCTVVPDSSAAQAVAEQREAIRHQVTAVLDHPDSDPELAERARLFLGKPAGLFRRVQREVHPLGAAVVARVLAPVEGYWTEFEWLTAIVDDWAISHGIGFAAEAGALLAGVQVRVLSQHLAENGNRVVGPMPPGEFDTWPIKSILLRLRVLLAGTDDVSYAEATRRLAAHRGDSLAVRQAISYLVPTRQDWLDEDLALIKSARVSGWQAAHLAASATTARQVNTILDIVEYPAYIAEYPDLVYSLGAHLGPEVAPILARMADRHLEIDHCKRLLGMLGKLPTDAAFTLLFERLGKTGAPSAAVSAMARFPRRAMRLLPMVAAGATATATTAQDLLRGHVRSHPILAEHVVPGLSGPAAQMLAEVVAAQASADAVGVPLAEQDQVPALLVTSPWTARRRRAPTVVDGLARQAAPARLTWLPGEREAYLAADDESWQVQQMRQWTRSTWEAKVDEAVRSPGVGESAAVLAYAPADLVRPHLANLTISGWGVNLRLLRRLLGRFGDDATGCVLRTALLEPSTLAGVLIVYEGTDVAARMAEWFLRSKTYRPVAHAWLERHPAAAARDLVPPALGKPGKERSIAETVLRVLDQRGHRDQIRAAATGCGAAAAAAVDEMLATDPLLVLPTRIPALPAWLDVKQLPQVLLADRSAALPLPAVANLCTMLLISKPWAVYAGVDVVREAVDPASLAELAWGLFGRWRAAGYPARDSWVLDVLGMVGDDETVRRLDPMIRSWPGESAHKRAASALDVLSAIGSDVALLHLNEIAEKGKSAPLRTAAQTKIAEIAENQGLSAEQLADRLVPDFGLDRDGSLVLDYGPRRFRVGFDEQLRPTVADEGGSRRKVLPKPAAADDPTLAAAAYARFAGLRKAVKAVAADQVRRWEAAMACSRRWTAAELRMLFVEHPLLFHLARRLVWAVFDEHGTPTGSFRVAEDRSLADVADRELVVPADAVVGIAHPLHLEQTLGAWSELFADYELLQPFPQLGRETCAMTDAERGSRVLGRLAGVTVPTGRILGLSHRGWARGQFVDGSMQVVTYKQVPEGRAVVVDLDPGIAAYAPMAWPEQTITRVWLNDGPTDWWSPEGKLAFGLLDDVTASELLRDLDGLFR